MNTNHNRFDEDHRAACDDCMSAYMDFMFDQADDARLDNLAELSIEGVE